MEINLELTDFLCDYASTPTFKILFKDCQNEQLLHSDRWSMVYDYVDQYCPGYKEIVTEITNYLEEIIKE